MVKAIDLINEQREREKNKEKIYKKIYKKIESKIIQTSSMNQSECWYLIPDFLFNIPLYNLEGCKNYIKSKLKNDGFSVYFTGDSNNIIVISWKY
jgi:hypothetical protein